ncbi:hypothetical protein ACH5RR_033043 [Cinchona calisaya]|uniref:Reverse transcriptase zinc-binding domain-containing protein n=1 Tax=Cinchona calisaya TaxID=153742 RepID=A0ABD2YL62_9GENT
MEDENGHWLEELVLRPKAIQAVREAGTTVEWLKSFWYKRHVPRTAFVMWLLCKRRLMTKDRMKAWVIQVDTMTKFGAELYYLTLSISVHCIWRRRNEVICQGKNINVVKIVQQTVQEVQLVTNNWRKIVNNEFNWRPVIEWGLNHSIFDQLWWLKILEVDVILRQ